MHPFLMELMSTLHANHFVNEAIKIEEPVTIEEALIGGHSKEWQSVAYLEYDSLIEA